MTVTPTTLRAAFPAFSSTTIYPDAAIQFWIDLAVVLLDATRWLTVLDFGIMLFVCHNLVLEATANKEAANGNPPGMAKGMLSGGHVDKVSYTYDTASVADATAGHWNLTTYGMRYVRLMKMFGASPIQVGAPSSAEAISSWYWPTGPFY